MLQPGDYQSHVDYLHLLQRLRAAHLAFVHRKQLEDEWLAGWTVASPAVLEAALRQRQHDERIFWIRYTAALVDWHILCGSPSYSDSDLE